VVEEAIHQEVVEAVEEAEEVVEEAVEAVEEVEEAVEEAEEAVEEAEEVEEHWLLCSPHLRPKQLCHKQLTSEPWEPS
jgi:uncharacterized coiled-coil DUF342 family protein